MSSGDDMSDSSNTTGASPMYSPQYSPLQQVPQLVNLVGVMSCTDTSINKGQEPYLRIIEQPQDHFRFRYRSEMVGTHGCLLGRTENASKGKTHPTVQLFNYEGRARIRCRLVQNDNDKDHPHQLEDEEDRDVSVEVAGSYIVKFAGLGIIHTAKKDVPQVLFQKYLKELGPNVDGKPLRTYCEAEAKAINLNIVRLKFSAHDIETDKEICPPVYSDPIHNMKSASTNELKICRVSKACGSIRGGENLFLLVEKVNKKDIEVHFVQVCPNSGEVVWRNKGRFTHTDVHHQYAIVCKTPAYQSQDIVSDVPVFIELVRPSNGKRSERVDFTYKPERLLRNKKRKYDSFSSMESLSSESLKSTELPTTVSKTNVFEKPAQPEAMETMMNITNHIPYIPSAATPSNDILGDAMFAVYASPPLVTPVLSQPNVPTPITSLVQLRSDDFSGLIEDKLESDKHQNIKSDDFTTFLSSGGIDEILKQYCPNNNGMDLLDHNNIGTMEYLKFTKLQADGVKLKVEEKAAKTEKIIKITKDEANADYSALYSEHDGPEVKRLIREICVLMKAKTHYKKEDVRVKLQQLMDKRLDNGDTFLHMTLCINMLPSMEFIVKLIHSLKMTPALNLLNDKSQTILHLAIKNNISDYVPFLISKGCNPMIEDNNGNNAIHYAVLYKSCLSPLLNAIKSNNVSYDLNSDNNEKQTPLHLAAQYGPVESVSLLLLHGASYSVRDIDGRTPLHLAAYADSIANTTALLAYVPDSDIDAVDSNGNTALQIACGLQHEHSVDIARLLLDKGANPLKFDDSSESAWTSAEKNLEMGLRKLRRNYYYSRSKKSNLMRGGRLQRLPLANVTNQAAREAHLRALLKGYISSEYMIEEDIKSEPEDDYESTEEDFQETSMEGLPKYIHEVSTILDRSDAWRELAQRLHQETLINWYEKLPSPTCALLSQVKDCQDNFTSRSLAMILNDMGEREAANIIYKCLD